MIYKRTNLLKLQLDRNGIPSLSRDDVGCVVANTERLVSSHLDRLLEVPGINVRITTSTHFFLKSFSTALNGAVRDLHCRRPSKFPRTVLVYLHVTLAMYLNPSWRVSSILVRV
jgi:hypothetical protein